MPGRHCLWSWPWTLQQQCHPIMHYRQAWQSGGILGAFTRNLFNPRQSEMYVGDYLTWQFRRTGMKPNVSLWSIFALFLTVFPEIFSLNPIPPLHICHSHCGMLYYHVTILSNSYTPHYQYVYIKAWHPLLS